LDLIEILVFPLLQFHLRFSIILYHL